MNIQLIKKHIYTALHGHLLNPPWQARMTRRKKRGLASQTATGNYLDKYVPFIAGIKPANPEKENSKEQDLIFSIWLQGEENAPQIVKACFASVRRNCTQKLIVLDDNSINDWINLPQYIKEKYKAGKIRPAHYADICRVALLNKYGGIWLDATCFVTSKLPQFIADSDFFIYMCDSFLISYSYVQNCFFRAKRGNFLVYAWQECIFEYWKHEDEAADYFVHQLLFKKLVKNNTLAATLFNDMPKMQQEPTHALWWDYRDKPFDKQLYNKLTSGSFFQKTEYKSKSARQPISGSFSDIIQNQIP